MSGKVSCSCNHANPSVTSSYARPQTNIFLGNQSVDQQNTKAFLLRQNQWLLMMLHHAMVCRKKEPCGVRTCAQLKKLLEHAVECKSKTCTKYCSFTQKLIKHVKGCRNPTCQLCGPIRKTISNKGPTTHKDELNRHDSAVFNEPERKRVRTDQHDGLLSSICTDMKTGHDTKEVSDGESTKELITQTVIAKELGCSVNEARKEPKVESVAPILVYARRLHSATSYNTSSG